MKLKILSVHNHGDFDKEHVLLTAVEDCDVGRYILADSTYTSSGHVSNKLRHMFWFPDKEVKRGNLVSVWTKPGTNTVAEKDGTPIHRFFWQLERAVWNDAGDCAVLLHVDEWASFKAQAG